MIAGIAYFLAQLDYSAARILALVLKKASGARANAPAALATLFTPQSQAGWPLPLAIGHETKLPH
ncbi:MAG TPA: hypothetical protein VKB76_04830 [Ktedonobacterales bacterium]|nr:hypothetical protein [Ktedonobacterales bacterium]